MTFPTNILQTVATYQEGGLALLENLNCFVATANTKFKEFNEDYTANLGSSITFDKPPRFSEAEGLVVSFQAAVQRTLTLTCDQAKNVSYTITAQDLIFNLDKAGSDYLPVFAKSAVAQLGAVIESNLAKNANSSVPVYNIVDGQSVASGALHTASGPFRFYGDGNTAINSFGQLAQMIANFKNFGAVDQGIKVYLPDTIVPAIVNSGLNQFAMRRNDEQAMSWEIGDFGTPPVKYYSSNLLPIHTAGTCGSNADTLTVVSTNDATGANITQITFSGVTTNAGAIVSGDLLQFNDGVSGQPNLRFNTFIGQVQSNQPVQLRATANADWTAGSVTVTFTPGLTVGSSQTDNISINENIVAGMTATVVPSHRCGLVVGGNALYLAMPRLPDEDPFPTASEADPDTQVSLRTYYGSLFGQNQRGIVFDATWGSVVVPEYSMRIAFPV